jgi:hypothetical protein
LHGLERVIERVSSRKEQNHADDVQQVEMKDIIEKSGSSKNPERFCYFVLDIFQKRQG